MHFCSVCNNMYYIRLKNENENNLIYYCRNCGNEEENFSQETIILSSTQFKKSDKQFSYYINQYTKMDPTLPRVNDIQCPNEDCPGVKDISKKEIIYLRYDESQMKYVYLCASCENTWQIQKDY